MSGPACRCSASFSANSNLYLPIARCFARCFSLVLAVVQKRPSRNHIQLFRVRSLSVTCMLSAVEHNPVQSVLPYLHKIDKPAIFFLLHKARFFAVHSGMPHTRLLLFVQQAARTSHRDQRVPVYRHSKISSSACASPPSVKCQ